MSNDWPEREEVNRLVDRIRAEQEKFPRYAAHVTFDDLARANALVADANTLTMGTEAMVTPSGAVEIKFDRRQVFAVCIYIVGHGGVYDGRP